VAVSQSAINTVVNVIVHELPLTHQPYTEPVQALSFELMNTMWCLTSSLALDHDVKVNKLVGKHVHRFFFFFFFFFLIPFMCTSGYRTPCSTNLDSLDYVCVRTVCSVLNAVPLPWSRPLLRYTREGRM